VAEISN